jgi:hypothetical protein
MQNKRLLAWYKYDDQLLRKTEINLRKCLYCSGMEYTFIPQSEEKPLVDRELTFINPKIVPR